MLITVEDFIRRTRQGLPSLVGDLQEETMRFGEEEEDAWSHSLPALAGKLEDSRLESFHLHLGDQGGLSLEYRLPASSSWCDAVLLGAGQERPVAVIVELKNWETAGDQPGPRPELVRHLGKELLHPSAQVRGYTEYCRRFHSTVQERKADVQGCVFMTRPVDIGPYLEPPHDQLVARYPVFPSWKGADGLPAFLQNFLRKPDPGFARDFESGGYRQDRNFVRQVAKTILDPKETQFVLLDEQRLGFEYCMDRIERALDGKTGTGKTVILIEGPPGSGKSVLAAHLWATLSQDPRMWNNLVFTTTSGAQRSNWEFLFRKVSRSSAGAGLVIPANRYHPGLTPAWVKQKREEGFQLDVKHWKENLQLFKKSGKRNRMPDDSLAVSIVDEAHALMDPAVPGIQGGFSGWSIHAGPQGWHIIRASRVSVFLMDSGQSYRDNERTTADSIERYARDFGVDEVHRISLEDAQFRCAGSKEYMDWLEGMLGLRQPFGNVSWRMNPNGRGKFKFEIVETPFELDSRLREEMGRGASARLAASYARKWKTKALQDPHTVPPQEMDFCIPVPLNGEVRNWTRPWNFAPGQDYTMFIQATAGSRIAEDPLAEVGCPYVFRGFDYDYLGLLWLSDLVWRDGVWRIQLDQVHESAWRSSLAAAKKEHGDGPDTRAVLERLKRGYRILLSRAIRGLYIWFEDEETRAHVQQLLRTS